MPDAKVAGGGLKEHAYVWGDRVCVGEVGGGADSCRATERHLVASGKKIQLE